eukprot:PhM_4_TR720/c1_g1_i3/m.47975
MDRIMGRVRGAVGDTLGSSMPSTPAAETPNNSMGRASSRHSPLVVGTDEGDALQLQVKTLQDILREAESSLQAKTDELETFRSKVDIWKAKVKDMSTADKQRLEELEKENGVLKEICAAASDGRAEDVDKILSSFIAEEREKRSDHDAQEQELRDRVSELEAMNEELNKARTADKEEAQRKIHELLERQASHAQELESSVLDLSQENIDLKRLLDDNDQTSKIQELMEQIQMLEEHSHNKQTAALQLQSELETARTEQTQLLEKQQSWKAKVTETIEASGRSHEDNLSLIARQQNEITELQATLETKEHKMEAWKMRVKELKTDDDAKIAKLETQTQQLTAELDEHKKRVAELEEAVHAAEVQATERETKMQAWKEKVKAVKEDDTARIESLEAQLSALRSDGDDASRKLSEDLEAAHAEKSELEAKLRASEEQ